MRRMAVFVNRGASKGKGADQLRLISLFADRGVNASVSVLSGKEIAKEAQRAASSVDVVVAAGGDGTVSSVAEALAETGVPMGILPLGTLNHFAADLGIPADLEDATEVVCSGTVREVDLGEVNGHFFINNSAIGLYPLAIKERRKRRFLGKWTAMAVSLTKLLWHFPGIGLRIAFEQEEVHRQTPLVFIGNNRFEMKLLVPRRRQRLDEGRLFVCLTPGISRLGLLLISARAVLGYLDEERDVETRSVAALRIDARGSLEIANDGEVKRLSPPLFYRIRPRALRVITGERHEDDCPSVRSSLRP